MRFPRLLFILLTALSAGSAQAATFFVGSALGCTHSTLAAAISAANANGTATDRIYLTQSQSFTGPLAVNTHLEILGGTLSCGSTTRSGRTLLSVQAGSALSIGSYTVTIDSVDFEHLGASGTTDRLITASGAFNLALRHVSLRGGHARSGGNLFLTSTGSGLATLEDVKISNGTATETGGGIYCLGRVSMLWTGPVDVIGNASLMNGGGVALGAGCRLDATAGSTSQTAIYIRSNTADIAGGGIYLTDFGFNFVSKASGATLRGAKIYRNQAAAGAGAYLSNFDDETADTRLDLINAQISANAATSTGGGIYGFGGSAILIDQDASSCSSGKCSLVNGNSARGTQPHPWNLGQTTGQGGAFFLENGAKLTVRQTWVEGSQSLNGASVLGTYGAGGRMDAEGVAFFANQGSPTAAVISPGSATLRLAFVSSAKNLSVSTHRLVSGGTVEIYSSVFGESLPNVFSVANSSTIDCVIVPAASGLPPGTTAVTAVANPALLFVDPVNGDLHLSASSPAIDYCNNSTYTPVDLDIDGQTRGVNHPGMGNYLGYYDLGADEVIP